MDTTESDHRAFTLIELMLVVAIIGLVAAALVSKYTNLLTTTREAALRGKLAALRGAVFLSYSDKGGALPDTPSDLVPKYISAVPYIFIPTAPQHITTDGVCAGDGLLSCQDDAYWSNTLGWSMAYDWSSGQIIINCTHTDSKGKTWSLW